MHVNYFGISFWHWDDATLTTHRKKIGVSQGEKKAKKKNFWRKITRISGEAQVNSFPDSVSKLLNVIQNVQVKIFPIIRMFTSNDSSFYILQLYGFVSISISEFNVVFAHTYYFFSTDACNTPGHVRMRRHKTLNKI